MINQLNQSIAGLLNDFEQYWNKQRNDESPTELPPQDIAAIIDHTLLKPEATSDQIVKLCEEAKANKFASVCVNSSYIPLCQSELKGSGVKVCTVIGFPLGAVITDVKEVETSIAAALGAEEIDMVINIGALKEQDYEYVKNDIQAVVESAGEKGAITKVIIETALLTDEEKVAACILSKMAGAAFVKTSTGFNGGGASERDVALMKFAVGGGLKVKASGGIRNRADALKMIKAGASRLGTSSGVAIVAGAEGKQSY